MQDFERHMRIVSCKSSCGMVVVFDFRMRSGSKIEEMSNYVT